MNNIFMIHLSALEYHSQSFSAIKKAKVSFQAETAIRPTSYNSFDKLPYLNLEMFHIPSWRLAKRNQDTFLNELYPKGIRNIHFKQGNKNDCVLLAGLYGFSRNPYTAKILEGVIKPEKNNFYKVFFSRGTSDEKTVTIKKKRFIQESFKDGVTGSLGIRVLEKACEYIKKVETFGDCQTRRQIEKETEEYGSDIVKYLNNRFEDLSDGLLNIDLLEKLSGIKSQFKSLTPEFVEQIQKNPDKYIVLFSLKLNGYLHAFCLENIENGFVTLINPQNTLEKKEFH